MRKISKGFCLILVAILAATIITMQSAAAQSSPKPSVPEFTVKYIDLSYDVPPVYGTDQYTGKTVVKQDGYYIENRSLQFTIKSQPFTPTTDPNGNQTGLYYNFRIKGAYGTEWNYYPFAPNGATTRRYGGINGGYSTESPADLAQSNSAYTTVTFQIPGYNVPRGAKLEVQVQAITGYMVPGDYMLAGHSYFFTGQYSDWSNTQTVNLPSGEPDITTQPAPTMPPTNPTTMPPTITPTTTPTTPNTNTQPETVPLNTFIAVTVALTLTIAALTLLLLRRQRKTAFNPLQCS